MALPISASLTGGAGGDAKGGNLSDYLYSANSGFRAPVINIATGGSKQTPTTTAAAGLSTTTLLLIVGGIILALKFILKR